jgi:hypothetical protein
MSVFINEFRSWSATTSVEKICPICGREIEPAKDTFVCTTNGICYHWNCYYSRVKLEVK